MTGAEQTVWLTMDASAGGASAALVRGARVLIEERLPPGPGMADALAPLLQRLIQVAQPASIAVVVGPGSFTGLRASLSIAEGITLALDVPVVGVSLREAIRASLAEGLDGRSLWVATAARRDRLTLETEAGVWSGAEAAMPAAPGRLALAGDASNAAAARLAARGVDVCLTARRHPSAPGIAAAAWDRLQGVLPPRDAVPLYGEPPRTTAGAPARPPPA